MRLVNTLAILAVCLVTATAHAQGLQPVQLTSYGKLSISWTLPTQNTDGTPLTDLAGCKIYWGNTRTRVYTNVVDLPGAVTNCTLTNAVAGPIVYIAGTAYNEDGNESDFSEELQVENRVPIPASMSGVVGKFSLDLRLTIE